MTGSAINWPAFWAGFSDGLVLAAIWIAIILWLAFLPTVGLLYFAGLLA